MGRSYADLVPHLRGILIQTYIIFYRKFEDGIEIVRVVSGYRNLSALFDLENDSN